MTDPSSLTKTLATPGPAFVRGSVFAGRYEIIEVLGRGGMGTVLRAFDRKAEDEIALKFLNPELASDAAALERFRNELKLSRRIVHKNVGRVYDLNEAGGALFITLEYVQGEDLKSFIRRSGRLTAEKAATVAIQVADGLAEAHRLDVVHRDLKPQNIMVDRQGEARIMDFGIARFDRPGGPSEAGLIIGTPEYMSPEQFDGLEADARADLYALGIILFEMVTGRLPFEADAFARLAQRQKSEIPPDPRHLNPDIPADLGRIILKCLEKDKTARYPRAEDLLADLRATGLAGTRAGEGDRITPGSSPRKETRGREISIAVLPFNDLSPEKDQAYFCDGLAEEIINALARITGLRVAARSSSFFFKGRSIDVREVGRRLNVGVVLEGSVRKSGSRLRITAQLINVVDGYQIWSDRYDRDLQDVFAIQDEISLALVDRLRVKLIGEEREMIVQRYTEDREAYTLYLQGRYFWNCRTEDDLKTAVNYFERSFECDPDYPLPYAGLADAYTMLCGYAVVSAAEAGLKAKTAAARAMALNPGLSEARVSAGLTEMFFDWRWQEAEGSFRKAIELNPANGFARHWLGWLLTARARFDEAAAEFCEALRADPLSLITNSSLGWCEYEARRYDRALEQLERTFVLEPNFPRTSLWRGMTLTAIGEYPKAIASFERGVELTHGAPQYLAGLGYGLAAAGQTGASQDILGRLDELSEQRYVSPFDRATVYAGLGDRENSLRWLERAFVQRDFWCFIVKVAPHLDFVRDDPRFVSLIRPIEL